MRVLLIDYRPGYEPAEFASFSSDRSCFDFDVVVWDPGYAIDNYERDYPSTYQGLPSLDNSSSVKSRSDIDRRRAEFKEFVEGGRVLFVIVRKPQEFYFDTGQRTYSGTGRNQKATVHVAKDDFWRALPLQFEITRAAGKNLQFVGSAEFAGFWRDFKHILAYEAFVSSKTGKAILKIAGTDKVASTCVQVKGGGAVVLLPVPLLPVSDEDDDYEEEEEEEEEDRTEGNEEDAASAAEDAGVEGNDGDWTADPPIAAAFQQSLIDLASVLRSKASIEPMPEWAAAFRLPGEAELQRQITLKETEIEGLRSDLTKVQAELDRLEGRKRLITGTGKSLEAEVEAVLELLGAEILESEPGRDDRKVRFPEGEAVLEIKGLKTSSGEKHCSPVGEVGFGAPRGVRNTSERHTRSQRVAKSADT